MITDSIEDNSSTRFVEFERHHSGSCGFHLTRSKWDPYPWVSRVDENSPAQIAGIKAGECVLEINGQDIVGKRISEVAERVRSGPNQISLLMWNCGIDPHCNTESLCCGPMPQNLQKLSTCVSSILSVLECPVCLDTIPPPVYQCENGHLMCLKCRAKSERCPVCRLRLTRGRSLLAEQVYNTITEVFDLKEESERSRKEKMQTIFKLGNKKKEVPNIKITQSHTNKFLARLAGKSTSVDNLSKSNVPINQTSFDTNLKTKSLSTSEICKPLSPSSSRANSYQQLNGRKILNLPQGLQNGSASCHGSFESLSRKLKCEISEEDDSTYWCPYDANCEWKIKGSDAISHFKTIHDGPLIQYFQPKIQIPLTNIQNEHDPSYVINTSEMVFFLKMLNVEDDQQTGSQSIHLWIWLLGDVVTCNKFKFQAQILKPDKQSMLSVSGAVHSLGTMSWKTITETRSGVVFTSSLLNLLEAAFINVEIQTI